MNAELISVGTELLLGEILNTDAQFLAKELSEIGIDVYHQTVVGDNKKRLTEAFETALNRADIIIASGGLGPTPDDLTKEVIAECMHEKLCMHDESLKQIEEYFKRSNRIMPENNKKQAMMPENGLVLKNNNGTAPGCIIEKNGKIVIILPGPPNELTLMYEESVKPFLMKRTKVKLYTKTYRIFGIGESALSEELDELIRNSSNPTVAPYAKTGEVHLRIAAKAETDAEADLIMAETEKLISDKFGKYIYSTDEKSLPETVFKKLSDNKITISTAESCTGGLIAKTITDFSGSSEIYSEGFVTYANEAKINILNVNEETLEKYGAVSEETVREMVTGLKNKTGADVCVAVTGIAGPGGGTEAKPVGLVYVAVMIYDKIKVKKLNLNGTREKIRYMTMLHSFAMINEEL